MTADDFLQIFKASFHKLTLSKVQLIKTCKNPHGRTYYVFNGLFNFVPPAQIWQDGEIDYEYLQNVLQKIGQESSNCIDRKFTKKIIKDGKLQKKIVFKFVFDVVPKNIVEFNFDKKNKTMNLIVKGYGLFS